jgi:hypothetical protein
MQTIAITKDTYQKLKWLDQFLYKDKGFSIPAKEVVHIIIDHLVAADGHTAARTEIPDDLKDFCEKKLAFKIVKLTTNPYLAILEGIRVSKKALNIYNPIQVKLAEIFVDSQSTYNAQHFFTALNPKYVKRLTITPDADKLDFFSSDPVHPAVIVANGKIVSLIMPMHTREGEHPIEKEKGVK